MCIRDSPWPAERPCRLQFCRRDPHSSVDTPWWGTVRTRLDWGNSGLSEGISHAIALNVPHSCVYKEIRNAQVRGVDEIFGTHKFRTSHGGHHSGLPLPFVHSPRELDAPDRNVAGATRLRVAFERCDRDFGAFHRRLREAIVPTLR